MNCVICNKKTAFTKVGWFGKIYPMCVGHRKDLWLAYGGGLCATFTSYETNTEVEVKHPENIVSTR